MSEPAHRDLDVWEQAMASQGPYENDVSFEGEAGFTKSWINCTKNPGHERFIPIKDFRTSHLFGQFQDDLVTEMVQSIADVTVMLDIGYISSKRPEKGSDGENYPFSEFKDSGLSRAATGWIVRARHKFESGKACPCPECDLLPSHQRVRPFGKVIVWTATHAVYDKAEALKTKFRVFYHADDDVESETTGDIFGDTASETNVDYLRAYGIFAKDDLGDWCGIKCVTHDIALWDRIRDRFLKSQDLMKKVDAKFKSVEDNLAIVVAHPHGRSARVSVGSWTHRHDMSHNDDFIMCRYGYDASTCQGSSGAPVFILGRVSRGMYLAHPHSRIGDNIQHGYSAYGINY